MSLLETVSRALTPETIATIAGHLGIDPAAARSAVAAAVPLLVTQLAKNTAQPQGAEALAGALGKHDGSILDDVVGTLTGSSGAIADGEGILGHIFGAKRDVVQLGVAGASGLDAGGVAKLLPALAPIVLGALGKLKRDQDLDVPRLAASLGQARNQVSLGNPLISVLDRDGDGQLTLNDAVGTLRSLI